jgi:hypothetical protein
MKKLARKEIVLGIMRGCEWTPYLLCQYLKHSHGIYLSESTLTRKFRSWPEIQSIPPKNIKVSRAWTYKVIA